MADLVFDVALGRVVEFYNRVKSKDPSTCSLVVVPIYANSSGTGTDANLQASATLAAVLANATERTANGWTRQSITASGLAALPSPNTTNANEVIAIANQTWTNVTSTGGNVTDLVIAYYPATGADSTIIPLTLHDFAITPDGSDVTAQVSAAGFFKASTTPG